MKAKIAVGILVALCTLAACDNTTDDFGVSITDNSDMLSISTDTFNVTSRSILADSVLARNITAYLGKVRDPETGAYITGDCMIQFTTLEGLDVFVDKDSLMSFENGEPIADSCDIRLFYDNYYGDSLQTMKLRLYELDKPLEENVNYYSNFNPLKEGYVRSDGLQVDKVYSLIDLNTSESDRYNSNYEDNIRIVLNDPYTDKDGVTYKNFGTYLLRKFYSNKEYYKNSYTFIHNLVPGFFIRSTNGLGAMSYIDMSRLTVYFKYLSGDTIINTYTSFAGTEEVLQTTTITNDNNRLKQLAEDSTCTYLKTPAGIFTELTLPVDDILNGHDNDTINTVKIALQRINNSSPTNQWTLDVPQTLLMIPKSQLYSFFETRQIADYKSSFLASYSSTNNTYTFSNISGLIRYMDQNRDDSDWNKAVLIPVSTSYVTTSEDQSKLAEVVHDLSMTSTKLVGGSANPNDPIVLTVIYSRFK